MECKSQAKGGNWCNIGEAWDKVKLKNKSKILQKFDSFTAHVWWACLTVVAWGWAMLWSPGRWTMAGHTWWRRLVALRG